MVAPCVGAWIETTEIWTTSTVNMSLPAWERGLKQPTPRLPSSPTSSLPAWERGLKLLYKDARVDMSMSLPAWERGLKPSIYGMNTQYVGRSLRGSVD